MQAATPKSLNALDDDELFERIDATLQSDDSDAPQRTALAPFMTKGLALRIHNRVQDLENEGTCSIGEMVGLALVVLDATGVLPPSDRGEQEKLGQRFDDALSEHAAEKVRLHRRGWRATRELSAAENRQRHLDAEDESLLEWPWEQQSPWPTSGTQAIVPLTEPHIERGGAGPSGQAAVKQLQSERSACSPWAVNISLSCADFGPVCAVDRDSHAPPVRRVGVYDPEPGRRPPGCRFVLRRTSGPRFCPLCVPTLQAS